VLLQFDKQDVLYVEYIKKSSQMAC